jgi:CRP-like cAMP-binding protein
MPLSFPLSNLLLQTLSPAARDALLLHLEAVPLPVGAVIYEPETTPRYVHFLTSGMASIVTIMADGDAVEVGIVCREGLPEAMHLLGPGSGATRCFMQIAGSGLRMPYNIFEQVFQHDESVRRLVLRYAQYQGQILGQLAACNRLHEVEDRLARWLLMLQDRLDSPSIPLTQEFLANMLGTRRSTVTLVAGTLQRSGMIQYRRGDVRVLDRESLEDTACECYAVTRRLFRDLYK